jgi:mono/diheme cytochrome c family protein
MVRKPYVISSYMYSNQTIGKEIAPKGVKAEIERINEKGILRVSPFVPEGLREITDRNRLQAGRMIALIECSSCHVLDQSGLRPLPQMVKKLNLTNAEVAGNVLTALGGFPYMPPFAGTEAEKAALAAFLVSLNK